MNESEFERLARDAAAGVRVQADMIADSNGALAQLLASEEEAASDGGHTTNAPGVDINGDRRGRSPWVPLLIAAASVAAVGGIMLMVRGDSPNSIVSTSEPDAPAPSEVEVAPDSAPVTTEQTSAGEASTTVPPDTTVLPPGDLIVNVPDEYGPQLTRTVLATYGRGNGPDDLGFMSCQECEPLRPFAPIVTDDGTVFVADADNERWQIFRGGVWTSLPYRPGEVVTASPVVGHDGLIYAGVADHLGTWSGMRIVSYDPLTMDVVESYPGGSPVYSTVDLVNGTIEMAGRIHTFDAPLGRPTWDVDWQTSLVTLSLSGIQRKFQLPGSWHTSNIEVAAVDDGSIVLRVYVLAGSGPVDYRLVRLWPDGSWAIGRIARSPGTANLDGRFSDTGYVQLEDTIVEYAFPTMPEGDQTSAPIELGTVLVGDVLQQVSGVEPEQLYRATIGGGVDQIGLEDCRECDPGRPWGPVVALDGRIVIHDGVNQRWITVTSGVPAATPLPDRIADRIGFVSQPVVDADGRIVVAAVGAIEGAGDVVAFFDPDDLSAPVEQVPADVYPFSTVELEGTDVIVNDRPVAKLPTSVGDRPHVEYGFDRSPATVAVTWDGRRRIWQFPYDFAHTSGARLPDGSITLTANEGGTDLLVRLFPDGTAASIAIKPTAAWNGGSFTTLDGLVQLELDGDEWVVRRYPLPTR